jgi:signal recognition particle subunit SRP54
MPGGANLKGVKVDEKAMAHMEAIIRSMTMDERVNPEIINSSRKQRIAKGSGTSVEEVNKLLRQFEQMKKMMKQFSDPKKMKRMGFGRFGKIPF